MIRKAKHLGWRHLWSSWSSRLLWAIVAVGGAWEIVPGLADHLPRGVVQGLAVAALVAKAYQNRERTS